MTDELVDSPNPDSEGDEAMATATATAVDVDDDVKQAQSKAKKGETKPAAGPIKILGGAILQSAIKGGKLAASGYLLHVPLGNIVGAENPRNEPENLYRQGYKLIDPSDPDHSILHMALSDDIDTVRSVVALFEEYENTTTGESVDIPIGDDNLDQGDYKDDNSLVMRKRQSIVGLAHSLAIFQVQPILVRKKGEHNFVIVAGCRRTAATAYLHAKSRLQVQDGVEGAKPFPPSIKATETKLTGDAAWEAAVFENMGREDFSPLQMGMVIYGYTQRVNPATGKNWTVREAGSHLGLKPGTARNVHAIAMPRTDDEVDEKGKVVKKGRGLTDDDRIALATGKKGYAWAYKKALGEGMYNPRIAKGNSVGTQTRGKVMPLRKIQALFDATAETNKERRQALAEVMGLTLDVAIKESDERIALQEQAELNKGKAKGKNKEKKAEGATNTLPPKKQPKTAPEPEEADDEADDEGDEE